MARSEFVQPAEGGIRCVDRPHFNARLVWLIRCVEKAIIVTHVAENQPSPDDWIAMTPADWTHLISWRTWGTVRRWLQELVAAGWLVEDRWVGVAETSVEHRWRIGRNRDAVDRIFAMETAEANRRW